VLPLEYRLRPRKAVVLGGSALTLVGFALLWSAPAIGLLLGGLFLILMVLGVLPYYVRPKHLVVGENDVQLPGSWAWSGTTRVLPYREIWHMSGAIEGGDTHVTLHDWQEREYRISADLLPSRTDFELVVSTLREKLANKRSGAGSDPDIPET
jgi:hypothetical protein